MSGHYYVGNACCQKRNIVSVQVLQSAQSYGKTETSAQDGIETSVPLYAVALEAFGLPPHLVLCSSEFHQPLDIAATPLAVLQRSVRGTRTSLQTSKRITNEAELEVRGNLRSGI